MADNFEEMDDNFGMDGDLAFDDDLFKDTDLDNMEIPNEEHMDDEFADNDAAQAFQDKSNGELTAELSAEALISDDKQQQQQQPNKQPESVENAVASLHKTDRDSKQEMNDDDESAENAQKERINRRIEDEMHEMNELSGAAQLSQKNRNQFRQKQPQAPQKHAQLPPSPPQLQKKANGHAHAQNQQQSASSSSTGKRRLDALAETDSNNQKRRKLNISLTSKESAQNTIASNSKKDQKFRCSLELKRPSSASNLKSENSQNGTFTVTPIDMRALMESAQRKLDGIMNSWEELNKQYGKESERVKTEFSSTVSSSIDNAATWAQGTLLEIHQINDKNEKKENEMKKHRQMFLSDTTADL